MRLRRAQRKGRRLEPGLVGGTVGLIAALPMTRLSGRARQELAAVELAFIAGAYPAMALQEGNPRATARESAAAGAFLACALAGLRLQAPRLLAAGLLAHGIWDRIHESHHIGTTVPAWYPGFCLAADIVLAVPLLAGRSDRLGLPTSPPARGHPAQP